MDRRRRVPDTEPPGATAPDALAVAVAGLRDRHTEPGWALLSGTDRHDNPVTAVAQQPLRPVRWPRFDTHVEVRLPYTDRTEHGLPANAALEALRTFEDATLTPAAGADGELIAHQTAAGVRTMHYYVDGTSGAFDALAAAAARWPKAKVERRYDPSFEAVSHLA